jgi:hypothetical protein
MTAKPKFSIAHDDAEMMALVVSTDKQTLAVWAINCTERVMPYFENEFPNDPRPRRALEVLREWLETGSFNMKIIRGASLDSHAAARAAGVDSPARSAARAAGQAVATAHVSRHAYGAAIYAQQAIFRASKPDSAEAAAAEERGWQYRRLQELIRNK